MGNLPRKGRDKSFNFFLEKIPGVFVILIGIVWKFSIDYIIIRLSSSSLAQNSEAVDYFHIVIALFLAPPIETLFFQLIPIELAEYLSYKIWNKRFPVIAACVSALCFGISHSYSILSVLSASLTGLALSNTYLIFKYRRQSISHGYIMTVLLHFIVNLIINVARIIP